jgi:hypothetical protein
MLFDFLVVRQITQTNPAHALRGPKYLVKKGKTPVWSREDAKRLLDSIPTDSLFRAAGSSAQVRSTQNERVDTCQATDHRLFLSFNRWAAPID